MKGITLVTLATLGLVAPGLQAQVPDTAGTIDRIVAVVGTRPILETQVEEQALAALRGQPMPTKASDRQALFQSILDGLINEELVVQAAQKDTLIKVTDEEVTQSVDELFRNVRAKFSSDQTFRDDLRNTGFQTVEEWRSYYADRQRRKFLVDRFWSELEAQGKLKPIPPTDQEVRDYFEQNKAAFPQRPAALSFRQVVVAPHAADSAKATALALADSILTELRNGADFATAAKRFSMDPATKDQGGSLNWIRRGQGWDQAFENAAFALKVGQISNPVETAYGYHLIQVERAQPAEVQVRHILIMPTIDSIQADSARQLAEQVYRAVKAGASFDSLQRLYHDKAEEREIQQIPLTRLPPAYASALNDVKEGDVAPLFRLEAPDPNRTKYAIVKVDSRIPAGDVRFEDVRDQIRSQLSHELARRRYLETLKHATYVDVRPA